MGSEQKRKVKKANRAAAARRRAKRQTHASAPIWDGDLPRTKEEIEAEMEALSGEMLADETSRVEHGDGYKKIFLTPTQQKFMRLQRQLFRVVFGREPSESDPVFWDRSRESEGVFPVDTERDSREFSKALTKIDVRPEVAYAIALTGIFLTEKNHNLYSTAEIEEWEAAIADYQLQDETGVVPLTPPEFLHAWTVVNETSLELSEQKKKEDSAHVKHMLNALERELGTSTKASAAMTRMAAVVAITQQPEFAPLLSDTGFSEAAVIAAASAEIIPDRGGFDITSFRRKLKESS